MIKFDLIVIGAGAGGLSVAAGAAQMGARVALIEAGEMGGDCLNSGCVPSKALIAAAGAAVAGRDADRLGITTGPVTVDFPKVMAHVKNTIAAIAPHDSQERFEGLGVTVYREWARFVAPRKVQVGDQTLTARRIVVACGTRPFVPPVPGLDQTGYLTNETIFDLTALPDHLIVMGGGPIGSELAQAFARLGSKVSLIEADQILNREDPEAAELVRTALRDDGVDIRENARVDRAGSGDDGLWVEVGDDRITGSHLLVATGRTPNIDDLGLEQAGIATDRGGIIVDGRLRSSDRHVFAIGDVASGLPNFTHVSGYHAGIVVRQALLGLRAKARHDAIPRVTYTAPELAQVGLTEAEARAEFGPGLDVRRVEMAGNDRARAEGIDTGFFKLMSHRGRPVGVTITGPHAGELIAPWAQAIAHGTKLGQMSGVILPYPTLPELGKAATGAYFSDRLFGNPWVERVVRLVQRYIP